MIAIIYFLFYMYIIYYKYMCCSYCLDIMFLVFMYINSFTCAHSSVPITIIVIIMHIVQCVWACVFSEWACVCVCTSFL